MTGVEKKESFLEGFSVNLRDVEISDAEFILSLRMNPKKNRFLNVTAPDLEKQKEYLKRYKEKVDEYYWVIEGKNGVPYGVVRIYDFQQKSFCPGSWLTVPGAPITAGIEGLFHAFKFGFQDLGFRSAHFDVRKENRSVIRFDQKIGAIIIKEDALNYYFTLSSETFLTTQTLWFSMLGVNR